MHPDGVAAGIRSETAQQHIDVEPEQVDQVVCRSRNQTSIERLHVCALLAFRDPRLSRP